MLARFCPPVAEWFRGVFAAPTPVQQEAWEAISAGEHALVVAPTGSGKTLAAFLVGIEFSGVGTGQLSLIDAPPTAASSRKGTGVRVLYVSPLKALGVDVENNLRAPLLGIGRTGGAFWGSQCRRCKLVCDRGIRRALSAAGRCASRRIF